MRNVIRKKRFWIFAVIIILLLLWLVPLVKCEALTLMYGGEFEGRELENNMIGEADYLKVLSYADESAEIYYVDCDGSGNIITFVKENDEWIYAEWDTLWSVNGNADRTIFPYWWHFIYFAF